MSFMRLIEKTKHLPIGHVDRNKAEKCLEKEYSLCRDVEARWHKRLPRRWFDTPKEVINFSNVVCDSLGQRYIRKVVFNSSDVKEWASAHYSNNEIHCKYGSISLLTTVHELTHHFGISGHGKDFCELENFLFGVAFTAVTGKQPKKVWCC